METKREETIIPDLYKVFHNTNNKEYYTFDGKTMLKDWNEYFKETLNLGLGVLNKQNEVTIEHKKTFDYIINNQKSILNLVITSLFDEYPKYKKESMLDDDLMPEISNIDELRQMIKPVAIEIYDNKNNEPYFGVEFNCTWDEEHGIGVLVNGNKVLRINDAATIFSGNPYINEENNARIAFNNNNNRKECVQEKKNYSKNICYDAITIVLVIIISFICEIWIFETTSSYDYLILLILYIIVIIGRNKLKKWLGIIMILASLLIIVESIIDFGSIFSLIFLLLGIFSIYHSIRLLKQLK